MKYLLTFENKFNSSSPSTHEELAEYITNYRQKIKLPFSASDYWEIHQRLDDIYGLESSVSDKNLGEFHYKVNKYKSFREVASDFDKLQTIKAVADFLNKKPINFCDMGCGLGQIVYFSKKIGLNAIGVEYQTRLKAAHNELGINVIYGDFFNMDLSFLKQQDIVYLYRPIDNITGLNNLLKLIYENTGSNVIVIFSMLPVPVNVGKFKKAEYRSPAVATGFIDCLLYKVSN